MHVPFCLTQALNQLNQCIQDSVKREAKIDGMQPGLHSSWRCFGSDASERKTKRTQPACSKHELSLVSKSLDGMDSCFCWTLWY